jgi:hypothetical protein
MVHAQHARSLQQTCMHQPTAVFGTIAFESPPSKKKFFCSGLHPSEK